MNKFFLQRHIDHLERIGNDDLRLILEFGPREFPTHELHQLLRRVRLQHTATERVKRGLFIIGASISVWIGAGFLCAAMGVTALGYFFLSLIPACCLLLIAGHLYLRRRFPTYRSVETLVTVIHQELERRRKDASIF